MDNRGTIICTVIMVAIMWVFAVSLDNVDERHEALETRVDSLETIHDSEDFMQSLKVRIVKK